MAPKPADGRLEMMQDRALAPASRSLHDLASFVVSTDAASIPDAVMARAADCVLDCLGAAAVGAGQSVVGRVEEVMRATMGAGVSPLWFRNGTAAPIAAAVVNASAATNLDIDDGHRRAKGHAGAAVISAALATGEETGASYRDVLAAVVMGYEAAIGIAVARTPERQADTASGIWSGIGAAIASARLLGASVDQMAQAILIAEQQSPQLASAMLHGFAGADVKEGIPWSVLTGMYAARLAMAGFTGYPRTFDLPELYRAGALCEAGDAYAMMAGLYFKPYACCRWIHAAIDGVTDLVRENGLACDAIEHITVRTFDRAVKLENAVAPATLVDAQFSIPFCIALACLHGREALLPMDARLFRDAAVIDLAGKVRPVFDPEMEALFPTLAPAAVTVRHAGVDYSRRVEAAFGDPTNPMSREDVRAKFHHLATPVVGAERATRLMDALATDPSDNGVTLRDLLRGLH